MHTHPTTTCPHCQTLVEKLRAAHWSPFLNMYNQSGLIDAITELDPAVTYTVVFADVDRLKAINNATGGHLATNRYLAAAMQVRAGELAAQFLGDEFVFILDERSRNEESHADAFVARIARQLAGQPLLQSERYALAAAQGCHVSDAKLSATFATQSGVSAGQVLRAIEQLSRDVLTLKAQRDATVRVI